MKIYLLLFIVSAILLSSEKVLSVTGDTIHVITHRKEKVITDPSKGFKAYKNWANFPSEEISYRKAILHITYQCPDSQRCGEWDYIDNIYLRRKGSPNDSSLDIELARMISPYGSRFAPDWKFSWKADITDFSFLLHDSAEIEFNHTGYESNTDRGWLITLDFELTEGTPAMEVLGYEKLWTGSFPYGNKEDDIENYLKPFKFKNENADIARIRILQTGHGMDDFENCAEFCRKYRKLFFDNELADQKDIWRQCGDNPLYPQAGTWIYDRANWCPGAVVFPHIYDFKLKCDSKNTEHTVDIEMEPYINPNKPSANYVFSSYIFYYKNPVFENDVSIEEIISPSDEDVYSRNNPVCKFPKLKIKNNGNKVLTDLKINYGIAGETEQTFDWSGNIESSAAAEIILDGIVYGNEKKSIFNVTLLNPNGLEDEYAYDNSKTSVLIMPQIFDPKIILTLKTNNTASQNFYRLVTEENIILKQKDCGTLENNKVYTDTISMSAGCYEFLLGDTANNGLDFWFNPEEGYGFVRITDINGTLIKAYNSDFGKEIRQQFIVTGNPSVKEDITPILNIFPVRNPGKFFCDIFLNEKQNILLQITTEDKKKIIFKKKLNNFKEGMIDIDLSKVKEGFYFVNVVSKDKTVTKKMKIKRDG